MMPVKDGWWFRAQQLRDQALAALPVIVMWFFRLQCG